MKRANSRPPREQVRRIVPVLAVGLLLASWTWLDARRLASKRDSLQTITAKIEEMQADVAQIKSLRTAPRRATERERPNDELLEEIRDALTAARISAEHWIGNEPSQPVRTTGSQYKRLNTRLLFEDIGLEELVRFVHALIEHNPALSASQLRLYMPHGRAGDTWNVDMTVSYLIYSPYVQGHS